MRILAYGVVQDPAESTQNPNNDPVGLPSYVGNVEVRPDLSFNTEYLDMSVKPRALAGLPVLEGRKTGRGGRME